MNTVPDRSADRPTRVTKPPLAATARTCPVCGSLDAAGHSCRPRVVRPPAQDIHLDGMHVSYRPGLRRPVAVVGPYGLVSFTGDQAAALRACLLALYAGGGR